MLKISLNPAPHRPPQPLTPSLAALAEAAAVPVFRPERLAAVAASLGLVPVPPTGRAVLSEPADGAARHFRGETIYAPVRAVARGGTRLLDLVA
jgi:hypothetical protein